MPRPSPRPILRAPRACALALAVLAGMAPLARAARAGPPAPAMSEAGADRGLFDDLGGHDGIARIVDASAALWLADPRIQATFEESDVARLRRLLTDQICHLAGGGCAYDGQTMYKAHRGLHLRTAQFNALAEDLQVAMDRLGVAQSAQNRLVALLAPMHRDIVTR